MEKCRKLVEPLHPFSDAIYQLEGDKTTPSGMPAVDLRKHAEDWTKKNKEEGLDDDEACPGTGSCHDGPWSRCIPRGSVVPVYSAAYSTACAVDPFFSDVDETSRGLFCCAPVLDEEHVLAAKSVIERVGGKTAVTQLTNLFIQGHPKRMQSVVAYLAQQRRQDEQPVLLGGKCTHREVLAGADHIRVLRNLVDSIPQLEAVAVLLLSAHATSHAA
jgi:hypothetical protein